MTQCSAPSLSLGINSANNRVTTNGFTYDSSGDVTYDGPYTYTWNAEDRMATAAASGTTTTYSYDGEGRRVEKSGSKLYWYGPHGEVLAESDTSGNVLSEYIYLNGQRIAHRAPNVNSGNTVYYYLSDRLGSAKQIASMGLNGTLNGCNSTTPTGGSGAQSATVTTSGLVNSVGLMSFFQSITNAWNVNAQQPGTYGDYLGCLYSTIYDAELGDDEQATASVKGGGKPDRRGGAKLDHSWVGAGFWFVGFAGVAGAEACDAVRRRV